MAISGILIHCLTDNLSAVEAQVQTMEEVTTYVAHRSHVCLVLGLLFTRPVSTIMQVVR